MNSFAFDRELTVKVRPGQPVYKMLEQLCKTLGYQHPTPLIFALLQREYTQSLLHPPKPIENLDKTC